MRLLCGLVDEYLTQHECPQLCPRSHHGPWWLAKCITEPLSRILACNGWSAAQAQPTPLVEIDEFRTGVRHFWRNFGWMGTIPSNRRWSGKTRDIPVYGVEILTDDYFVLSQYTHLIDGQRDRQTNRQTQLR